MQASSILLSSTSVGFSDFQDGPVPAQRTRTVSDSSGVRPTLVFTQTPIPLPSSARNRKSGLKSVKKRPPTPGGPAVGNNLYDIADIHRRHGSSSTTRPAGPASISEKPVSIRRSQSYHSHRTGPGNPGPPSMPTFRLQQSSTSLPSKSSLTTGNSSLTSAIPLPPQDVRYASTTTFTNVTARPHQRSAAAENDTASPQRPSRHVPIRIDTSDNRPRSSSNSTVPDSPNTKDMMARLLASPDYYGTGDTRAGGDDLGSDSGSSIKFASIEENDVDGIDTVNHHHAVGRGQRGASSSKISRVLGTTSDDEFVRPRYGDRSGVGDGSKSLKTRQSKLVKQRVDEGFVVIDPLPSPRRDGSKHSSPTKPKPKPILVPPGQHPEEPLPTPQYHSSSLTPPPSSSAPSSYPRIDALHPSLSGIKRSQSASAAVPTAPSVPPTRSPIALSFPTIITTRLKPGSTGSTPTSPKAIPLPPSPNPNGANSSQVAAVTSTTLEAPFISTRSSSKLSSPLSRSGVDGTGEPHKKAKRRRSALLWMKEHTGLIPTKYTPDQPSSPRADSFVHSAVSSPSSPHHNIGRSDGHGHSGRKVLGMDPKRNISVPSAFSYSSNDSPLPSLTPYSPISPSFDRSDLGHSSREEARGYLSRPKGSLDAPYLSHDLESHEDRHALPPYTVVGGTSEERWVSHNDVYLNNSNSDSGALLGSRSTTISGGMDTKPHKSEKRGFGFRLNRSGSSKKEKPTGPVGEEGKRHRNRLRGRPRQISSTSAQASTSHGARSADKSRTRRSYSANPDHSHPPVSFERGSNNRRNSSLPRKDSDVSGGKLWRFVKRISSNNGLYPKHEGVVPPVPSLPSSAHLSMASPTSEGHGSTSTGLARILVSSRGRSTDNLESPSKTAASSKTDLSGRFKYSGGAPSADGHEYSYSHSAELPPAVSASSEHLSSNKLRRSFSAHSSASSLAEHKSPPPLPHPPSAFSAYREMVSTIDQGHLSDSGYQPSRGRRFSSQRDAYSGATVTGDVSWVSRDAPTDVFPSLPTPPRRTKPNSTPPVAKLEIDDGLFKPDPIDLENLDESSSIPEFSIDNPVNAFSPRSPVATSAATSKDEPPPTIPVASPNSQTPPPRPARNARRPQARVTGKTEEKIGETDSNVAKLETTVIVDDDRGPRPRTGTFGPSSVLDIPPPPSSQDSDSPTIPSPNTKTLTEHQKAMKWDALLERSTMAGGTLHLKLGANDSLVESP